jgi:hypothetical protein
MTTDFSASAVSAGALISTTTFEIPRFQREYAWGAEEYQEFWDDVKRSIGDQSYFLGLIILTGQGRGRKQVVDGQQRLLTITLLAAALHTEAIANRRSALADSIRADFLRTLDYKTDEITPRIVLADSVDNRTLELIVNGDALEGADLETEGDGIAPLIVRAYSYLKDQLHRDLAPDPFKRLGTWTEFLSSRLEFAVFVHPDPASAYRVFEVINTRGRELTTADLLKNFLLSQAPQADQERLYLRWQAIARSFPSGAATTFVQYIRHVATVIAGHIPPKDLFDYLAQRKTFVTPPPAPAQLLGLLEHHLPLYLQMVDPTLPGPASDDALKVYAALNELGVAAVRPLLLAIPGTTNEDAGREAVLNLVVRRIVVGNLGTGNVERRLGEAAFNVHSERAWDGAMASLRDLDPPVDQFVSQVERRSLSKATLQFVRRSIIQSTRTPSPEGWLHYIRPRQGAGWDDFVDEDLAYWGSTIGNSILLRQERRPIGATSWEAAKDQLLPLAVDHEWVARLAEFERWGRAEVAEVGRELAQVAARVWYE